MAQVTNIPGTRPNIGGALGSGLGNLLGMIVQKKLEKKRRADSVDKYKATGMPAGLAELMPNFSENIQAKLLMDYMKSQGAEQESEGVGRSILDYLGGSTAQQAQQFQQPQQLQQFQQPQQANTDILPSLLQSVFQQQPQLKTPVPRRKEFAKSIPKNMLLNKKIPAKEKLALFKLMKSAKNEIDPKKRERQINAIMEITGYSRRQASAAVDMGERTFNSLIKSRGKVPIRNPFKKQLTDKVVDHFLKRAGNDPKRAKQLAKAAGYKV